MITIERYYESVDKVQGLITSSDDGRGRFELCFVADEVAPLYITLRTLGRDTFAALLKEIADCGGTLLDATETENETEKPSSEPKDFAL